MNSYRGMLSAEHFAHSRQAKPNAETSILSQLLTDLQLLFMKQACKWACTMVNNKFIIGFSFDSTWFVIWRMWELLFQILIKLHIIYRSSC